MLSTYKGDFGAWETIKVVGKGGSSTVFKARISESGKLIAAKQIDTDGLTKEQVQSIKAEIETIKDLVNTNIIAFIGSQQVSNKIFIFLEYADRGSIRQYYQKKGPLKELQASNCTRQILLGLQYLHNNGIAHRDIKCANCLLTKQGIVKLADFGASKKFESESIVSGLKGTPNWMAPEVIKGMQMTTGWMKADVWSLGCTVVEMMTAKLPFSEFDNPMTAMYHIANGRAPSLKLVVESLGENAADAFRDIEELTSLCCAADPQHRPTVNEILGLSFVRKRASGGKIADGAGGGAESSHHSDNTFNLLVEGKAITTTTLGEQLLTGAGNTPLNSSRCDKNKNGDNSNNNSNKNSNSNCNSDDRTDNDGGSKVDETSSTKLNAKEMSDAAEINKSHGDSELEVEVEYDLDAYEDDFEEEHEVVEERLNSNASSGYIDMEVVSEGNSYNNEIYNKSKDRRQNKMGDGDKTPALTESTTLAAGTLAVAFSMDELSTTPGEQPRNLQQGVNIGATSNLNAVQSVTYKPNLSIAKPNNSNNNGNGEFIVDTAINSDNACPGPDQNSIDTPIMSHSTRKKFGGNNSNTSSSSSNNGSSNSSSSCNSSSINSNSNSNSNNFGFNITDANAKPSNTNGARLSQIPRKTSAKSSSSTSSSTSSSSSSSSSSLGASTSNLNSTSNSTSKSISNSTWSASGHLESRPTHALIINTNTSNFGIIDNNTNEDLTSVSIAANKTDVVRSSIDISNVGASSYVNTYIDPRTSMNAAVISAFIGEIDSSSNVYTDNYNSDTNPNLSVEVAEDLVEHNRSLLLEPNSPVYQYASPVKTLNKIKDSNLNSVDPFAATSSAGIGLFDSNAEILLPKNIGESFDCTSARPTAPLSSDKLYLASSMMSTMMMKEPPNKSALSSASKDYSSANGFNNGANYGMNNGTNSSGNNVKFIEAIKPTAQGDKSERQKKRSDSLTSSSSIPNFNDNNTVSSGGYSKKKSSAPSYNYYYNNNNNSSITNTNNNNSNNSNSNVSAYGNTKTKGNKSFRSKSAGVTGHDGAKKLGGSKVYSGHGHAGGKDSRSALESEEKLSSNDSSKKQSLPPIGSGTGNGAPSTSVKKPPSRHAHSAPAVSRSVNLPPMTMALPSMSSSPHGMGPTMQLFPVVAASYHSNAASLSNSSKDGGKSPGRDQLDTISGDFPRPANSLSPRLDDCNNSSMNGGGSNRHFIDSNSNSNNNNNSNNNSISISNNSSNSNSNSNISYIHGGSKHSQNRYKDITPENPTPTDFDDYFNS